MIVKSLDTTEKQELYILPRREPGVFPQPDYVKAKLYQDKQFSCPQCIASACMSTLVSRAEKVTSRAVVKPSTTSQELPSYALKRLTSFGVTLNSIASSRYARWIIRFNGVSAKYLPQYPNWFIPPERVKDSLQPVEDLSRTVCSNHGAVLRYRRISDEYLAMLEP